MNDDQKQTVYGTLLGTSKLEHDATGTYLVMQSRNKDWLACKASELKNLERDCWRKDKTYYWVSRSDPFFEEADQLCYVDGRKAICETWLDALRDIAFVVWYGDVGCLVGRNRRNACLRTPALFNVELAVDYLNRLFLDRLGDDNACRLNMTGKYKTQQTIVFTQQGTLVLIDLISQVMPQILYRLIPC